MSDVRLSQPAAVQDRPRNGDPAIDAGEDFLLGVFALVKDVILLIWRAPLLVLALVGASGVGAFVIREDYVTAGVLGGTLLMTLVMALYAIPPVGARLRGAWVAQWLRVFVYYPRWERACFAAQLNVRAGGEEFLPRLASHQHSGKGRDRLVVRMAPGQTLLTWQAASASLASTLTAHSVMASAHRRPGWVTLDVLRRDPLGGEEVAPNPADATVARRRSLASGGSKTGLSMAQLTVQMGWDEFGRPLSFDPFRTAHCGMQGATRAGKSSTAYTLLAALAQYPNVVVTGVDPSGVLLAPFSATAGGRGGAFVAIGTAREDIEHAADVLKGLVTLMDLRIKGLLATEQDKITDFTVSTPTVWCVMEEYPGLLAAAKALDAEDGRKAGDRLTPRLESSLGRIVKEGAKVGVFALVMAQRMSADALRTDDRMNLGLRITHCVDNGDAVAMLHEGLTREENRVVRDFRAGVALVEEPGRGVRRVRVFYTDYATYRQRVADGIAATHGAPPLALPGPRADVIGEVVSRLHPVDEPGSAA